MFIKSSLAQSVKFSYSKFFWSVFFRIWTEHGDLLRNMDTFYAVWGSHFFHSRALTFQNIFAKSNFLTVLPPQKYHNLFNSYFKIEINVS